MYHPSVFCQRNQTHPLYHHPHRQHRKNQPYPLFNRQSILKAQNADHDGVYDNHGIYRPELTCSIEP